MLVLKYMGGILTPPICNYESIPDLRVTPNTPVIPNCNASITVLSPMKNVIAADKIAAMAVA